MKKIRRKLNLIIISLLILSFFFIFDVSADNGVILLTSWDNSNNGQNEGIDGYINFTSAGGTDDFEIYNGHQVSGDNSFEVYSDGAGFWNLTTDFDYIYQVNLSIYMLSTAGDGNLFIYFNDSDDNNLIKIQIDSDEDMTWYGTSGNTEFFPTGNANTRYYLVITHLNNNYFNVSVYDSSFDWIAGNDSLGGNYAGTWTNFSHVYITCAGTTCARYFDNFYIDITPDDLILQDIEGARCSNPVGGYDMIFEIDITEGIEPGDFWAGWDCVMNNYIWDIDDCINGNWEMVPAQYVEHETEGYYNETIRHVLLPVSNDQISQVSDDPSDYKLMIDSTYCDVGDYIYPYDNGYAIVWSDVDVPVNGKIDFAVSCDATYHIQGDDWYWFGLGGYYGGWGETKVHNKLSSFYDGGLSGTYFSNFRLSICWYYNDSDLFTEDPDILPIINEFDNAFGTGDIGEGYVEFYGYDIGCYYKIGRGLHVPTIVYNLTGYGPGNGTKTLLYQINKVVNGTNDEIVYNDFIEVVNSNYSRGVRKLNDFSFDDHGAGRYYIMVWNTSSYGTVIENFVHRSDTIRVCPRDSGEYEPSGGNWYGLPFWVPWVIGIFITLFVTMSPLIIATYITRKTKHTITIPNLLYVGFFFFGLIISVQIGFIPSYIPFVILFGMVLFFIVQWYSGKKSIPEGE